jgi:4-aminobutyrate aminotransferase-like enzyme
MHGLEVRRADGAPATREVLGVVKSMLHRGFILLPEGAHSQVISLSPPLTITRAGLEACLGVMELDLAVLPGLEP